MQRLEVLTQEYQRKKTRAAILAGITASISAYLEQFPDATYSELEAKYGPPEQIAAAYVENAGTADILKEMRIRRRIMELISFTAAVVLVIWLVFVILVFIDARGQTHGRKEYANFLPRFFILGLDTYLQVCRFIHPHFLYPVTSALHSIR